MNTTTNLVMYDSDGEPYVLVRWRDLADLLSGGGDRDEIARRIDPAIMSRITARDRAGSPEGEDIVIAPEMLKMIEDLADTAAYDAAKNALLTGDEERIPHDVMMRFMAGENPVKVWRAFRGLAQKDLAASAGISQSMLSQIEHGTTGGSIETLRGIAAALGVKVDDLEGLNPE